MNTTSTGQRAEAAVEAHLKTEGFSILDRNWKTNICEIDLVAKQESVIYFIEVKYRSRADQGTGLEYIGNQKLKRIKFASELWVQSHNWEGDCRLLGAEVSGDGFDAISLTELD